MASELNAIVFANEWSSPCESITPELLQTVARVSWRLKIAELEGRIVMDNFRAKAESGCQDQLLRVQRHKWGGVSKQEYNCSEGYCIVSVDRSNIVCGAFGLTGDDE